MKTKKCELWRGCPEAGTELGVVNVWPWAGHHNNHSCAQHPGGLLSKLLSAAQVFAVAGDPCGMHVCPRCGRTYKLRTLLRRHLQYECGQARKRLECSVCRRRFSRPDSLHRHLVMQHFRAVPSQLASNLQVGLGQADGLPAPVLGPSTMSHVRQAVQDTVKAKSSHPFWVWSCSSPASVQCVWQKVFKAW